MMVRRCDHVISLRFFVAIAAATCLLFAVPRAASAQDTGDAALARDTYGDQFLYYEAAVNVWRLWWPDVPLGDYRMTMEDRGDWVLVRFTDRKFEPLPEYGQVGNLPTFSVAIEKGTYRASAPKYQQ